jgi:hypothetical protein
LYLCEASLWDSGQDAIAFQRRTHASHPLKQCQFSAVLPDNRRHKMSIQRPQPSLPPAISADYYAQNAKPAKIANQLHHSYQFMELFLTLSAQIKNRTHGAAFIV